MIQDGVWISPCVQQESRDFNTMTGSRKMQRSVSGINPMTNFVLVQFGLTDREGGEISIGLEQFFYGRRVIIIYGAKDAWFAHVEEDSLVTKKSTRVRR